MKIRDREVLSLQGLVILVVCHNLALGQIISQDFLVQRPASWFKAREFCQRHYVDLAVLRTEEQYLTFLNATAARKASFWLGLQRQSVFSGWKWVNGEELSYEHWYHKIPVGRCATLEAMLRTLLARYCEELHSSVCQGPVSPQPVTVDLVGSDHTILSWNVSAFMQMTPHYYNVTTCTNTCNTLLLPYTDGSTSMSINISNLTSATEYFVEVSAFVVRPDNVTGRNVTLQSNPTGIQVITVDSVGHHMVIIVTVKLLKAVSLLLLPTILFFILKNHYPFFCEVKESKYAMSPSELANKDTAGDLNPTGALTDLAQDDSHLIL